jgi:3-hydroxy-9,10-secoandrosta-1,3,5(10)-triene-9,17-dione monooxygenase reductase component
VGNRSASPSAPPDARRFRDTIGLFATGVAIVVGRVGDEVLAMTVNAVSSVSLDPMLVMFCPGKMTRLAEHLGSLTGFSINILRHEQEALSTYFAGGWKEPTPPPFRFVPSRSALRLEGSLASIDCELTKVIDAGDHWLVMGRVVELHSGIGPHRPLLFYKGRYEAVDFSASAPAPDLASAHEEPPHVFYGP